MYDIKRTIKDSIKIKQKMLKTCIEELNKASNMMYICIKNGKKIIWCGNGGSAADAQHMAAELMGGLTSHIRKPIASIALTTDTSFITAWSNDKEYSTIFSRQLEGIGREGDILIAISTSGNSKNIINAIKTAKKKKLITIILTGSNGGKILNLGDIDICIPSNNTQRIQEGHLLAEHILCELLEARIKVNHN
jgi:Phosphoheptose isomerase